jgi:hypothetical protein
MYTNTNLPHLQVSYSIAQPQWVQPPLKQPPGTLRQIEYLKPGIHELYLK